MSSFKNKSLGFTLVEIMVAIVLFGFLAIGAYSLLKGSMDATLKSRVQQDAQEKASAIINAVTPDLKSSFSHRRKDGANNLNFQSSVIFPDPDHPSSAFAPGSFGTQNDANKWEEGDQIPTPGLENTESLEEIPNNINRLVFYSNFRNSGTNNFFVTEYRVSPKILADNGLMSCAFERLVWAWDSLGDNTLNGNLQFNEGYFAGATLGNKPPALRERQTVVEMPNAGDVIVFYTARNIEPQSGVVPARLSQNQYLIKAIVAENVKSNLNSANIYSESNGVVNITNRFVDIMKGTDLPRSEKYLTKNYRTVTLDASVTVPQ